MKRESCYKIQPNSFDEIVNWLKCQNASEDNPVLVHSCGGRSQFPAYIWLKDGNIYDRTNPNAKTFGEFVITKKNWNRFLKLYKEALIQTNGLASFLGNSKNYSKWGCRNRTFWPAVLAISKAYQADKASR